MKTQDVWCSRAKHVENGGNFASKEGNSCEKLRVLGAMGGEA